MAATNTTPLVRQRSQVMLSNSTKARLRGAARAFGSARRSAGQERADKLAVARREGTCNVTAPESDVRIEARPAAKEFVKAEWIRMTYEIRLRPTVLRSRKKPPARSLRSPTPPKRYRTAGSTSTVSVPRERHASRIQGRSGSGNRARLAGVARERHVRQVHPNRRRSVRLTNPQRTGPR